MNLEMPVEVRVAIDKDTDELVTITKVDGASEKLERRPLSDFLSLPETARVYVDNKWRIHVVAGETGMMTDPLSEDIRYEE